LPSVQGWRDVSVRLDFPVNSERYIARQPIFTEQKGVMGYELLFRGGLDNFFSGSDSDMASRAVVDNLFLMGVDVLTAGSRAFINFTRHLLVNDFGLLLPRQRVVVEVLESIEPDGEVLAACQRLKAAGYQLALDDLVSPQGLAPLMDLADYAKVDFVLTSPEQRQNWVELCGPRGIKLLAEKVETPKEFDEALGWGYQLFQGYFFCRPEMVSRRDIPAYKLNYVRALQAASEPNVHLTDLESAISVDASLSYRLLRYLNSPAFGFRTSVESIRHGLMLLGERQVRRWISMVALLALAEDKPAELAVASLVRGRFCQLLGISAGVAKHDADLFLLGMLSLLDAILGRPLGEVLDELPVSQDIKAALLNRGGAYQPYYDAVLAYESGNWEAFNMIAAHLGPAADAAPQLHLQAVEWATRIFQTC
jgi:c-di-GMP-related signal transduction protein